MRYNKKILMVTTTALFAVGCFSLMGAMKYQNVKTEASDIKEDDVAKAGVDVTSEQMEGETPSEEEKKMDKEKRKRKWTRRLLKHTLIKDMRYRL